MVTRKMYKIKAKRGDWNDREKDSLLLDSAPNTTVFTKLKQKKEISTWVNKSNAFSFFETSLYRVFYNYSLSLMRFKMMFCSVTHR